MPRRNKYGAVATVVDGIRFASKAEARRYGELKILEASGEIARLEVQPRLKCVVGGVKVCEYVADFAYWMRGDSNQRVFEDVKGVETAVFKLKRKLILALYPGIRLDVIKAR